ncbi:MAG: riboflavin synthase [Desulfovibrionaceae bacterium]
MFTGIIHGLGEVLHVSPTGQDMRMHIKALYALEHIQIGESIAVNGACLTVESHGPQTFTAFASAETLARTSLGALTCGARVNLERALALGDRLGGHMVSGHVDCLGVVEKISLISASHCVRVTFPAEYQQEIISKGSVSLDGISLTVNDCGPNFLEINAIPETWNSTTMNTWQQGRRINLETDIIGKYVRRMLQPWQNAPASSSAGRLTEHFLKENGF